VNDLEKYIRKRSEVDKRNIDFVLDEHEGVIKLSLNRDCFMDQQKLSISLI
jgi:hypothetical protein